MLRFCPCCRDACKHPPSKDLGSDMPPLYEGITFLTHQPCLPLLWGLHFCHTKYVSCTADTSWPPSDWSIVPLVWYWCLSNWHQSNESDQMLYHPDLSSSWFISCLCKLCATIPGSTGLQLYGQTTIYTASKCDWVSIAVPFSNQSTLVPWCQDIFMVYHSIIWLLCTFPWFIIADTILYPNHGIA